LSSRRFGIALLLLLLPVLPSCGYRLQVDPGSRFLSPDVRVQLRPFANASLFPDAGAYLAGRLREEMRREGFRGQFDDQNADFLVEGSIRDVRESVFSYGADRYGLERRLTLLVDIRVVELVRGRLLWKEEGLSETASYFAGADFQYTEANRRMAFEEASRRIARRIGQMLPVLW
jgi:Lipopolysaccharide-assembly